MSTNQPDPIYGPTLRLKSGEMKGLRDLAADVADLTLPHLIVPPRDERDEELQSTLFDAESVPAAGSILSKYWVDRRILLNATHLFDDFGEEKSGVWLPKMFEMARASRVAAIPVATLSDLIGLRLQAFADSVDNASDTRLALSIAADDIAYPDIGDQIMRALDRVKLDPAQCVIIADFSGSDFSQPEIVADVIEGTFERLEEVAQWKSIIFQGSSYPEVNPAEHEGEVLVPRDEWQSWRRAVRFSRDTPDHLVFGDYAADCSRMLFGKSNARAIRHYRYTTPSHWLVVRGAQQGRDGTVMREVCNRILHSGHFAGRSFSLADKFIDLTAKGGGPGNSTMWRAINTAHHITRVVRDVGAVKGHVFSDLDVEVPARQIEFFE